MQQKVEGLKACVMWSPYEGYAGAWLELAGPWTATMADAFSEEPVDDARPETARAGVWVWEGSCTVEINDVGTDHEYEEYLFEGAYRRIDMHEARHLTFGRYPFSGEEMPPLDELPKRFKSDS